MKTLLKISLMILVSALWTSCKKDIEDLSEPIKGLGGVKVPETDLDRTLYELYTKPYNISVRYRWNAAEMTLSNVVPADEAKVLTVMNVLKKGWIEPFEEVAGLDFVLAYVPKQYYLIGSYVYLSNGNIVLGSASHGLEINIYGVNQIDWTNDNQIRRVLGTIHHELAHVLHQNKMYPVDYELVSVGDYKSAWSSVSTQEARNLGFASPYGSSSPNEDFATMVATLLGGGDEGFDELVATANEEGQRRLRAKETIIVNYFMQAYGINFRELQAKTSRARLLLQGINQELYEEIKPTLEGKFISIMEGSKRASVTIDMDSKTISLARVDENNQRMTSTVSFTMDETGFVLANPIIFNGHTYTKIEWDSDLGLLYINEGGNRVYFDVSDYPTMMPYTPILQDVIGTPNHIILITRPNNVPQMGTFKTWLDNDLQRVSDAGRTFAYFAFDFGNIESDISAPDAYNFEISVRTAAGGSFFIGRFRYKFRWIDKQEGTFELEYVGANSTNSGTLSYSQDLRQIATHRLKIGYFDIPGQTNTILVGFQSLDDPTVFCYGILGNSV